MKSKKMLDNKYALIIEKEEMIIEKLTQFAIKNNIGMAQFQMIGAVCDVVLGYVPAQSNHYMTKTFNNQWELLSTLGAISWDKITLKPIIHCHTTISSDDFNVIGGHMVDAKVAIKVEVIITVLSNEKVFQIIDNKSKFEIWDI